MGNKTILIFLILELLFLGTGVALITSAVVFKPTGSTEPHPLDAATWLLLQNTPLTTAYINAALIFATFILAIPGFLRAKDKLFLRLHAWAIIVCGATSLVVGLIIWFSTLQTRTMLGYVWAQKSIEEQSQLQKQFSCCGYYDANTPPFVTDATCPNVLAAARIGPCMGPFSAFANNLLDIIFTSLFGFVAVDGLLFLSTLVMIKSREERERYRLIDEKEGGGF